MDLFAPRKYDLSSVRLVFKNSAAKIEKTDSSEQEVSFESLFWFYFKLMGPSLDEAR